MIYLKLHDFAHSQHSTDTDLNVEGRKILLQIATKKRWVLCFVCFFATKSLNAVWHSGKDLGFVANPTFATSGLCVLIYKKGVIILILSDCGKDILYGNHLFLAQRHVKMAAIIGCIIKHIYYIDIEALYR